MKQNFILGLGCFSLSLLLFVGCAGKAHYIGEVSVPIHAAANPAEEVVAVERLLSESREQNVPLLAPTWFSQAQDSYLEGKKMREEGGTLSAIFNKLGESRIELQKANEAAALSRTQLSDVLEARQMAMTWQEEAHRSGAVNLTEMKEQFAAGETQLLELAEDVENGKIQEVQRGKHEAIAHFVRSGGTAAEKATLDVAKRVLEESKTQGADEIAPQTLAVAQQSIARAETFAMANPSQTDGIKQLGSEAAFYAQRSLRITQQARGIGGPRAEQVALGMEMKIDNLRAESDAQKTALRDLSSENQSLADTNLALAQKEEETQSKNARITQIQNMFTPEEAEVLRSDTQLIIRLKSLEFAVGQSSLSDTQFELMAKVQRALKLFEEPEVIVEGHTDSTGSDEVNARLSQQRADTVREYLVSNQVISEDKITAVGRGEERPIASNKTKAGRATNRRIDILTTLAASPDRVSLHRNREDSSGNNTQTE